MTEVADVLKATRVPGTKLFFLGCFDSRVTVLSQQRRALNLVDAILAAENLVRPNGRVAVVGGGVAGVTAAAAFAIPAPDLRQIDLFERESDLLHLQRHSDRDLHPFIYDWATSLSEADDAGLPRSRAITRWRPPYGAGPIPANSRSSLQHHCAANGASARRGRRALTIFDEFRYSRPIPTAQKQLRRHPLKIGQPDSAS